MSDTIRSRTEAIRAIIGDKQISTYVALEMIDKLADDTLTELNKARWITAHDQGHPAERGRLIPDPDSHER